MSYTNIIMKKELKSYFDSPAAYIILVIFLVISGWFFASPLFINKTAEMRSLFNVIPIVYIFFIPAITMGLIAKEKVTGTIETLATLPIREKEMVMGKFWASIGLIAIALFLTFPNLFTVIILGKNIDYGAVFCGYIGLLLLGGVYSAIGLFTSTLTNNQIVAFIISFFIIAFLYVIQYSLVFIPAPLVGFFQYISIGYHLSNIARGVIDTRNIIYFLSLIVLFLYLAEYVLRNRKWK